MRSPCPSLLGSRPGLCWAKGEGLLIKVVMQKFIPPGPGLYPHEQHLPPVLGAYLRAILVASPIKVHSVPTFAVFPCAFPWILPEAVINYTRALSSLRLSRSFPGGMRGRQVMSSRPRRHRGALLLGRNQEPPCLAHH